MYVLGPSEPNDELRFSLRSLVNVPHGNVWLAGWQPSWTDNVRRLPVKQGQDKYRNVLANLSAIADCDGISEQFLLFNDDFFCMRPVDRVGYTHLGTIRQAQRAYASRRDRYANLVRDIGRRWPEGYFYGVHMPMPMERGRLRDVLDDGPLMTRTDYGNLHEVGGVKVKDVKHKASTRPKQVGDWLSTSDASFRRGEVGKLIRARFPERSRYERRP